MDLPGERVFCFAGFVLDPERRELFKADGEQVRLGARAFEVLRLLVSHQSTLLSKAELMEAVWPDTNVGEDSLFQAIREIRTALGDNDRQAIKLVSGRGYIFTLDVTTETELSEERTALPMSSMKPRFGKRAVTIFCCLALVVAAVSTFMTSYLASSSTILLVVPRTVDLSRDERGAGIAQGIYSELVGGLSRIDGVQLVQPADAKAMFPWQMSATEIRGELSKSQSGWVYRVTLIEAADGKVAGVLEARVSGDEANPDLIETRLAAGVGYPLAVRLGNLREGTASLEARDNVVLQQADASIAQTTQERFEVARSILEKSLAARPGNIELQIALAAMHLRGVQMTWYTPEESQKAEAEARSLIESALSAHPESLDAMNAYCRLLTLTNAFAESLVACANILDYNPWDGMALYHLGMTQVQLGRFDDALATFTRADAFDTPAVSRWTWMLGAGWTTLMMGRNEEAIRWLERAIAITPASGRSFFMLAAAYSNAGRQKDAEEAFAKAMALRPGSDTRNISLSARNASNVYLQARQVIARKLIELGLPEPPKS